MEIGGLERVTIAQYPTDEPFGETALIYRALGHLANLSPSIPF
jgi:hypothetical protein